MQRRDFLKQSSAVSVAASLPGFAISDSAKSAADLEHGTTPVIDAKVTHTDIGAGVNEITLDGGLPHTYVHQDRFFLISIPPSRVNHSNRVLLRTPHNLTRFDGATPHTQRALFKEIDYSGASGRLLSVENGYDLFRFEFVMEGSAVTVHHDDNQLLKVQSGIKKAIKLDTQDVEVPKFGEPVEKEIERPGIDGTVTVRPQKGTRTTEVTPVLEVRNNGDLSIIGREGVAVVPDIPEFPIRGMVSGSQASDDIMVTSPEDGMAIIHRDYPYNGTFDNKGCSQ